MKNTHRQVRAESSAAKQQNQTSKRLEDLEDFESDASLVMATFESNWEFEMSDGVRGALYILRSHVTDLIESVPGAGRSAAGVAQPKTGKSSPAPLSPGPGLKSLEKNHGL